MWFPPAARRPAALQAPPRSGSRVDVDAARAQPADHRQVEGRRTLGGWELSFHRAGPTHHDRCSLDLHH